MASTTTSGLVIGSTVTLDRDWRYGVSCNVDHGGSPCPWNEVIREEADYAALNWQRIANVPKWMLATSKPSLWRRILRRFGR